MKVSDFDYELPEELIAQDPLEDRSASRLLVLDKNSGALSHRKFTDITEYLSEGDCLVINDTKVIPARLLGVREGTGGHAEILLLKRLEADLWECLARPARKLKTGSGVSFGDGMMTAEIAGELKDGARLVRFYYDGIFEEVLDKLGEMPLPPYIKHKLSNRDRYQTVYAEHEGSAAAPTAGLHFTEEVLKEVGLKGVNIVKVTLHVGLGTFRPVKADTVEDHDMHSEYYELGENAAEIINRALETGKRVFAVGTTSVRVLESAAEPNEAYDRALREGREPEDIYGLKAIPDGADHYIMKYRLSARKGETAIFIYPGYEWKIVECLITNFHLPKSTLLMLVSALAGRDNIMAAYNEAIRERYRLFSFGDAMLIRADRI